MGLLDFFITDSQKKITAATRIGIKTGLFVECPVCRDVTEAKNQDAVKEQVDKQIHDLIIADDPIVKVFYGNEEELKETLDKVARRLPYHCVCESI